MNPLESHAPEISEHAAEHRDDDACRNLWRTVIERTVLDLDYLQRFTSRANLQKHEIEKLRRIEECPPGPFVEGTWFEKICEYLEVDVDRLRRGMRRDV